jgi:hypothetical protein
VSPGAEIDPSWTAAHSPTAAAELSAAGATVLVTLPGELDAALAAAAIYRWHGATIFVTSHRSEVAQAIEMTDTIRGVRPPALTRRALA